VQAGECESSDVSRELSALLEPPFDELLKVLEHLLLPVCKRSALSWIRARRGRRVGALCGCQGVDDGRVCFGLMNNGQYTGFRVRHVSSCRVAEAYNERRDQSGCSVEVQVEILVLLKDREAGEVKSGLLLAHGTLVEPGLLERVWLEAFVGFHCLFFTFTLALSARCQ